MSVQDRNTPEAARFAWPLWLGLGVAVVLLAIPLAGSNLPVVAMTPADAPAMTAAPGATPASTMSAAPAMKAATSAATTTAATVATTTTGTAAPAATTPATPAPASEPAKVATAAPATTTTPVPTKTPSPATTTPAVASGTTAAPAAPAPTPAATQVALTSGASPAPDVPVDQLMAPGPLPEMVLGDAKAPITIVEYASMTCPHCADFHKNTFPALKSEYIDTGKAKLVFREFPLDNIAAAVSQLARCLGPVRYFAFVGTMFDRQSEWHTGNNDLPKLMEISKQAGFTDDSFKKCVTDQKQLDAIKETRQIADEKFHVDSTPTFFINGVKLKGGHDIQDFDAVIGPMVKG